MKRYRMYVKLNTYNKDQYSHYADAVDVQPLIHAAEEIFTRCIIFDRFTDKIIWTNGQ